MSTPAQPVLVGVGVATQREEDPRGRARSDRPDAPGRPQLSANALLAVQSAKELALRKRDIELAGALSMEKLFLRLLQTSEDIQEGAKAFSEQRSSRFKGV